MHKKNAIQLPIYFWNTMRITNQQGLYNYQVYGDHVGYTVSSIQMDLRDGIFLKTVFVMKFINLSA